MLNVALFRKTARQWRDENPDTTGNIRDQATLHQLVVLANLESMNAQLIREGLSRDERVAYLSEMAAEQLKALKDNPTLAKLNENNPRLLKGE